MSWRCGWPLLPVDGYTCDNGLLAVHYCNVVKYVCVCARVMYAYVCAHVLICTHARLL